MVFSACIFSITRLNTLNLHAIKMNQLFKPNCCTALDHIANVVEFGTTIDFYIYFVLSQHNCAGLVSYYYYLEFKY